MTSNLLVLVVGIVMCGMCQSFIVYDCSDPNVNITIVSLKDVAKCPETDSDYTGEKIDIQVIQRNEIKQQMVKACLIEVTRFVMHCGMHSHTSAVAGGLAEYVHPLGADLCKDVHKHGSFRLFQQVIGNVKKNTTTSASLTLMGHLKDDGSCEGITYTEDGHTWSQVIVLASVKIHLREYLARVKMDINEISLENGIACPYLDGYCIDTEYGETVWDYSPETSCEQKLTLLYEGAAELIKTKDAERFVVVEQNEKIFAMSLKESTHLCSSDAWQTEHPKLLIVQRSVHPFMKSKMELIPANTDLTMYINSKLLYIEQAYKRSLNQLYTDSIHRRCLVHRETLRNLLLLAPLTSNALGAIIKNQLGYTGRVLGEVLYIAKCVPRIAQIRRTETCYNELPITVNNNSYFMAVVTHIVQSQGEQIECNALMPPLYHIDNEWIGLSPNPAIKNPPTQLWVEEEPKLRFGPIQPLSSSGL